MAPKRCGAEAGLRSALVLRPGRTWVSFRYHGCLPTPACVRQRMLKLQLARMETEEARGADGQRGFVALYFFVAPALALPCLVVRKRSAERHRLCATPGCCFDAKAPGRPRSAYRTGAGELFAHCCFHCPAAFAAAHEKHKIAGPLRQLREKSVAVYQEALDCIGRLADQEMQEHYQEKSKTAPSKKAAKRAKKQNDSWANLLTWRKKASGATKAKKLQYRIAADKDAARAARKFPSIYGPDARPAEQWMRPKALAFRDWCCKKSWQMCGQCGRMVRQKLRGSHLRGKARGQNELKACKHCESHGKVGYWAPQPDEQPLPLRKLMPEVVAALRPFDVHTGPKVRAPHGYLVHTDMFRVSLKPWSVEEALQGLPKQQRRKGQKALAYLLQSKESSYCNFALLHSKFLEKRARAIERGETWPGAPVKRMPANFLETVGLECAVWPHLYWRTDMCETYVRSQDKRRLQKKLRWQQPRHRRGQDKDIEDQEEEADIDGPKRHSAKASFLAKVHSCVAGYSSDPDLLHFIWDLWLWSAVGGAKNASGVHIREALAGKPFSPELWRTYHMALVDLQKQVGWPSLFITIAPYEWSFPYHAWVEDELQKTLSARLHAPVAETLHLAHVLTQAVKGLLTGANDGVEAQGDHVFSGSQCGGQVKHWVARLEFQDGKRKRGASKKDPQFYHGSGRPHVHILLWLDDLLSMDVADKIKAEMPKKAEEPEMHDLVVGSQLDWDKSGWPQREGPTVVEERRDGSQLLRLHHPSTAVNAHCRAYVLDILQGLHCHVDVLASDGRALVLRYCASPLAAFYCILACVDLPYTSE